MASLVFKTLALLLLLSQGASAMIFKTFPKSLRINGKKYEIEYQYDLIEGKNLGTCDPDPKEISVSLRLGVAEAEATVIHEILHAMAAEYGFTLSEEMTRELERAIYDTFDKNKWKITVK